MKKIILSFTFLLLTSPFLYAETITLSTYYPAPFGNYDRLRLVPRATLAGSDCTSDLEGMLYYDATDDAIRMCDGGGSFQTLPGVWTQTGTTITTTDAGVTGVGIGTTTPAQELHVVGNGVFTSTVGIGTTTPDVDTLLHINEGGLLITGTTGETPVTGIGTRLMWIPSLSAFRVGTVVSDDSSTAGIDESTFWDGVNIGTGSVAFGARTLASASYSTAMGFGTTASAEGATAFGNSTTASGDTSIAMGGGSTAAGEFSTAMGNFTTATGQSSTAMGDTTTAQAQSSLVIGRYNVISGTTNSWIDTDPVFVIGNGDGGSDGINDTANAVTVLKNGNITLGSRGDTKKNFLQIDNEDDEPSDNPDCKEESHLGRMILELQDDGDTYLHVCGHKTTNLNYEWKKVQLNN